MRSLYHYSYKGYTSNGEHLFDGAAMWSFIPTERASEEKFIQGYDELADFQKDRLSKRNPQLHTVIITSMSYLGDFVE